MKRLLAEGMFGEPVTLCSRRLHAPMGAGTWRADHRRSGGILYEINIHELDWLMDVGGPVRRVYARTLALPETRAASGDTDRANDHLWFTLEFESGAIGTHEGSWISPLPQFYRGVAGTTGGAQTDEWGQTLFVARTGEKRQVWETLDPPFDLRANFLDAIEGSAAPVADVENTLAVMTVAEAILESARSGVAVIVGSGPLH
jgi:predicted dehydrogenase